MPGMKPKIFLGFSLFLAFFQNKKDAKRRFRPSTGTGLVNDHFGAVFREIFSWKTTLFSSFPKKSLLNNCVLEYGRIHFNQIKAQKYVKVCLKQKIEKDYQE